MQRARLRPPQRRGVAGRGQRCGESVQRRGACRQRRTQGGGVGGDPALLTFACREQAPGHRIGALHAQPAGKRGAHQFAGSALVIGGGEFEQRDPVGRQRRQRVDHGVDRTQAFAQRRGAQHHADALLPTKRHAHQRSGRQSGAVQVVEGAPQWRIDGDAQCAGGSVRRVSVAAHRAASQVSAGSRRGRRQTARRGG
ncbi:hypothetical protein GALL_428810 [mine drainage metagenome]|uniref:Uncharacterized protein n=1 Tax=mine drainage metagenome TaxID=410659 RepID=A0A1J5PVE8_9ZZZZ